MDLPTSKSLSVKRHIKYRYIGNFMYMSFRALPPLPVALPSPIPIQPFLQNNLEINSDMKNAEIHLRYIKLVQNSVYKWNIWNMVWHCGIAISSISGIVWVKCESIETVKESHATAPPSMSLWLQEKNLATLHECPMQL
jgi:hypothetical protein